MQKIEVNFTLKEYLICVITVHTLAVLCILYQIANNTNMIPEKVLSQSYSIVIMYIIITAFFFVIGKIKYHKKSLK